jgi:hypothetical protein
MGSGGSRRKQGLVGIQTSRASSASQTNQRLSGFENSNPSLPTKGAERFPFLFPKKLERTGVTWVPTQAEAWSGYRQAELRLYSNPSLPTKGTERFPFSFQKMLDRDGVRWVPTQAEAWSGCRQALASSASQTNQRLSGFENSNPSLPTKGTERFPFLFPRKLDRDGGSNPIIRFHSGGKNVLLYRITGYPLPCHRETPFGPK